MLSDPCALQAEQEGDFGEGTLTVDLLPLNTTTASCLLIIMLCCALQAEQEGDFGEGTQTVDLLPEGGNQPVTDDNKQLYVDLYMQHLLDNSIQPQFDAFQRGFKRVSLSSHLSSSM